MGDDRSPVKRRKLKLRCPNPSCYDVLDREGIGIHWQSERCHHPKLDRSVKEITHALLSYNATLPSYRRGENTRIKCFLSDKQLAIELFDIFGPISLRVDFANSDEFSMSTETYVFKTYRHPYFREQRLLWGSGSDKSLEDCRKVVTGPDFYAFLYAVIGTEGFENRDLIFLDSSQMDIAPFQLRDLHNEFGAFHYNQNQDIVLIKNTDKYKDKLRDASYTDYPGFDLDI